MYTQHKRCRACNFGPKIVADGIKSGASDERLIPVFDLGIQPLANDFCSENEPSAGYAPLTVLFCPACTLAQLSVVVNPAILYSRYLYTTSPSQTMQDHFAALTAAMREEQPFKSCLEIGSNDGAFLRWLAGRNISVAGIDPAENLNTLSRFAGIPTVTGVLDLDTAKEAQQIIPRGFDVIVARHVFCHVDNWKEFVNCLTLPSHENTLVCIEVPYVKDLLENGEFDTIYHEHTSYFTIMAMEVLLKNSPWRLQKIVRFPIHGGAIVLMLRRRDWPGEPDSSVSKFLASENITARTWDDFAMRASANMAELKSLIYVARTNRKRVAAIGASAKSTVWINACGFTRKDIAFITDTTPQKLWKVSPGSDIPIVDEGAILRELPDFLICFAWNFADEIIRKNQRYLALGGQIVVPIPKLEVISRRALKADSTLAQTP